MVKATEGVVSMDGEVIKYKPYPEPALFIVAEVIRFYSCELIASLYKKCGCAGPPSSRDKNELYFLNTKMS